jgi:hypothetical protein
VLPFSANCSNNWNLANNGHCWREIDKDVMTWEAAYMFCIQKNSSLLNSNDGTVINKTSPSLKDGKRCWTNSTQINDPLQGWYCLDGGQFNANNRQGLYGYLTYTGEERCAIIRESQNGIWEDIPCSAGHSFVCKNRELKNTVFIVYISNFFFFSFDN